MNTDPWELAGIVMAVVVCVLLPLALGHIGLALAGAGGLLALAWALRQRRQF